MGGLSDFGRGAGALPDAMFDADPEIQALRADIAVKAKRAERETMFAAEHALLMAVAEWGDKIKEGMKNLMLATIDDAAAGDMSLPRTAAVQRQFDDDAWKLEAAKSAHQFLTRTGSVLTLRQHMDQARQCLNDVLLDRKRQHVRGQPEWVGRGV